MFHGGARFLRGFCILFSFCCVCPASFGRHEWDEQLLLHVHVFPFEFFLLEFSFSMQELGGFVDPPQPSRAVRPASSRSDVRTVVSRRLRSFGRHVRPSHGSNSPVSQVISVLEAVVRSRLSHVLRDGQLHRRRWRRIRRIRVHSPVVAMRRRKTNHERFFSPFFFFEKKKKNKAIRVLLVSRRRGTRGTSSFVVNQTKTSERCTRRLCVRGGLVQS